MLKFNDYLKEAKELSPKQKKIAGLAGDKDKIDSDDLKALRAGAKLECKEEAEQIEELDEGKMKELAMDLKDMSHDEFHKHYGHPKHHYDPTNFKKPVEKGHEMDRAKALAQRGLQSVLSKEEVEAIEGKLAQLGEGTYKHEVEKAFPASGVKTGASAPKGTSTMPKDKNKAKGQPAGSIGEEVEQIDELSKGALGSYAKKATKDLKWQQTMRPFDAKRISNREKGIDTAIDKLAKEEVEQIDELSKDSYQKYKDMATGHHGTHSINARKFDVDELQKRMDASKKKDGPKYEKAKSFHDAAAHQLSKTTKALAHANKKLGEEAEEIEEAGTFTGKIVKGIARVGNELKDAGKGTAELGGQAIGTIAKTVGAVAALPGATKAAYQQGKANTYKSVAEDVSAEMSPYLKATLAVMDEGKIDDLRDAQRLRAATKSAYDKDYKADDKHPHITLNKGTAYGGSNQKDDEGDEKPDNEKQEKRGRGRPHGSKSGARQKGVGKDNSIDGREYTLHLPK